MKFPTEYDALEIVTPELKEKLLPVSRRLKEFEKERGERRKVRKRTKAAQPVKDKEGDVQMGDASSSTVAQPATETATAPAADGEGESEEGKAVAGAELEDESVYREKESKELEALVHPDLKKDVGASVTGQYELVGASFPPCRFLFVSCHSFVACPSVAVLTGIRQSGAPSRIAASCADCRALS